MDIICIVCEFYSLNYNNNVLGNCYKWINIKILYYVYSIFSFQRINYFISLFYILFRCLIKEIKIWIKNIFKLISKDDKKKP